MLSEYEQQRAANMARNDEALAALGIPNLVEKKPKKKRAAKKRPRQEPTREPSRRARALPVPMYTPGQDEVFAAETKQSEIEPI